MTTATPVEAGVSLEAWLAAKECRAARQADWLRRYQQPIISLTLVTPGTVKNSLRYRNTMGVALQMCDQLLWENRWPVRDRQVLWLPRGLRRCGPWRIMRRRSRPTAWRWSRVIRSVGCGIWM